MNDKNIFSIRYLSIIVFISLAVYLLQLSSSVLYSTKIVFCNVGQGDSSYIRTLNIDILVDTGKDNKVLQCLGKFMPVFDHEIDLVLISHTDNDHVGGLKYIKQKYLIKKTIIAKDIYKYAKISLGGFKIVPVINNSNEGLVEGSNDSSSVFIFTNNIFSILYTGDRDMASSIVLSEQSFGKVDVLKVPHHGSSYNLNDKFLELADPALSVISVGNNNTYGHPSTKILSLFQALKQRYLRTDEEGDVVVTLLKDIYTVSTQKSGIKYEFNYR